MNSPQFRDNTHDLHLRYVFLPPNVVLVLWIVDRYQVVAIHDDVHDWIDETGENWMAAAKEFASVPGQQDHTAMMVDVQKGDLIVLLAQHKENGVQQIKHLQQEVCVTAFDHNYRGWAMWVVHRFAHKTVAIVEIVGVAKALQAEPFERCSFILLRNDGSLPGIRVEHSTKSEQCCSQ